MRVITDLEPAKHPQALAIGTFDGIHRGHRYIIDSMVEAAHSRDLPASVLTFEPPPAMVFQNSSPRQRRLLTRKDKLSIISSLNVDRVYEVEFDREFARTSPTTFAQDILDAQLNARAIFTGIDFQFGHERKGDVDFLTTVFRSRATEVHPQKPILYNGNPLSSSRIRSCIRDGDLKPVQQMLGRSYMLREPRERGEGRGQEIGFPTINFPIQHTMIPRYGVYLAGLKYDQMYTGLVNIGTRPTVDDGSRITAEIHLLDEVPEIPVGDECQLYLDRFIRGEKSFDSVDKLAEQIQHDIDEARSMLQDFDVSGRTGHHVDDFVESSDERAITTD